MCEFCLDMPRFYHHGNEFNNDCYLGSWQVYKNLWEDKFCLGFPCMYSISRILKPVPWSR